MWNASELFDSVIGTAHTTCAKIEIWSGSEIQASSEDSTAISLVDGNVQVQRDADVRRTCSWAVSLVDKATYKAYFDPLLGFEYRLFRCICYPDGTKEYVPLGLFKIDTATTVAQGSRLYFNATGFDRARLIAQNPWTTPFSVANATNQITAITNVIANRAAGFTYDVNTGTTTTTTPSLFYSQNDAPWDVVKFLSQGIGFETYFDQVGALCSFPVIDPLTGAIALDLTAGPNGVRIGNLSRSINMQETYNGVVCRGSAPWLLYPVTGEAWDDDPVSPTWRGGAFGSKPKFIDSATVTSQAQAQAAAQAELYKVLGKTETIDFTVLPDPRLDVGDIVRIYDTVLDIFGLYVIDTLNIPLLAGPVTGTTRLYTRSVTA